MYIRCSKSFCVNLGEDTLLFTEIIFFLLTVFCQWWISLIFVFSDIAQVSVEHCQDRYKEMKTTHENRRYRDPLFTPEFIVADCSKVMELSSNHVQPYTKNNVFSEMS